MGSKRLLEGDGDTGYAVSIPGGSKDHVAQVQVNPVQLLLREQFQHLCSLNSAELEKTLSTGFSKITLV